MQKAISFNHVAIEKESAYKIIFGIWAKMMQLL